ncbi:MAG: Trm112 family protein [Syntrophomonadaceae bacterium]|nr:Trm112 family protein [Syntrophomonadaceae bacterium]
MKAISEKVSYLQGLAEGSNFTDGNPQARIVTGILEILEELAGTLGAMGRDVEGIKDYVESIDEDLCDLEQHIIHANKEVVELECPACGEELYFEADLMDDDDVLEITCPNCNDVIYINDGSFDFDYDADNSEQVSKSSSPS